MKSVAVDPGYDRVGIAVFEGGQLLHSECFIPEKGEFSERLLALVTHLRAIFKKYKPETMALETLFFTKNQKTAMRVAEARGAVILSATEAGIPVVEYSPQAVKIAVTGAGNADKAGVIRMVERLVSLPPQKRFDDEYDAIALGLAHTANLKINIHKGA